MSNHANIELRGKLAGYFASSPSAADTARDEAYSHSPVLEKDVPPQPPSSDAMTQVEALLDTLRPAMEADGGGVDLDCICDGVVAVRLKGLCLDCPSSDMTLRLGIEKTLKTRLAWVKSVIRVDEAYPKKNF